MSDIIKELEKIERDFWDMADYYEPSEQELGFYKVRNCNFQSAMYISHKDQYSSILEKVNKEDIVFDAGAGDLRFPLMLSQKVKKVYAIDLSPTLISKALKIIGYYLPLNLIIICGDWCKFPIPKDVTIITCLVNNPIVPKEWHNYRVIFGSTSKIVEVNNE